MTTSNVNFRNGYVGTGAQTVFSYSFKIDNQSEILVIVDNVIKTITTHYTVTGVGSDGGGTVVFVTAPALDAVVVLLLRAAFTQLVNLTPQGPFDAETVELELDKLTRVTLSLLAILGTPSGGKYLSWSENEREIVTQVGTDLGLYERFGPSAVTLNAFTKALVFTVATPNTNYGVFVTTSWQTTWSIPTASKTTAGFTVEFGTAAPASSEIYVRVYIND